jgi:hypothetical protein
MRSAYVEEVFDFKKKRVCIEVRKDVLKVERVEDERK